MQNPLLALGVACLVTITACGKVVLPSATGDAGHAGAGGASAQGSGGTGDAAAAGGAASGETFVAVSVGEYFACGLTASGGVLCWGNNDSGQLSNSAAGAYGAVPGLASGVTAISVGGVSACALTADGGVKCWGDNDNGQLGNGTLTSSALPVPVTGLESGVTAISVGASSACALSAGGGVQCWGYLGSGSPWFYAAVEAAPVPVAGLESGVAAISVGAAAACALSTQGGVQCWGDNWDGQFGINFTDLVSSAAPVPVPGLTAGITAVSVGADSACALAVGGLVECWGRINRGFFVTGPSGPVAVAGLSSGVTAISVGGGSSSACALTVAGQVECWGDTLQSFYAYPPIPVTGLASGVTAVSVGDRSACVIVSGEVECWDAAGDPRPVAGLAGPSNAGGTGGGGNTGCADPLTFADPDVEQAVRQEIGIPSGPIHAADVANLTDLGLLFPDSPAYTTPPIDIDYVGVPRLDGLVTSLVGVDCLPSLRSLEVNPYLVDLAPLGRLPNLSLLSFSQTFETSFPPMPHVVSLSASVYRNTAKILSACPSLRYLILSNADLGTSNADLNTADARAAFSALTNLTTLSLSGAGLTDTTLLAPLSHLADVELSGNQIQDISSLSSLSGLRSLDLSGNQIADLTPLALNLALGYRTAISIRSNPSLDCAAQEGNIATLRTRGVTVDTDCL